MAVISVHMIDVKGVNSEVFNLSESDMARVVKALGYIYTQQGNVSQKTNPETGEVILKDPDKNDICKWLAGTFMQHILTQVTNTEVQMAYKEVEHNLTKIIIEKQS